MNVKNTNGQDCKKVWSLDPHRTTRGSEQVAGTAVSVLGLPVGMTVLVHEIRWCRSQRFSGEIPDTAVAVLEALICLVAKQNVPRTCPLEKRTEPGGDAGGG